MEINEVNSGIRISQPTLNLLMYADDIVCITHDYDSAEVQVDTLSRWCDTWGMFVNTKKTQVVRVRPYQ